MYFLFFRQVDELRASLYAPFKPELSHKGSIDINDVQGSGDIVTSGFDPIELLKHLAPQNDPRHLSFVKDIFAVGINDQKWS